MKRDLENMRAVSAPVSIDIGPNSSETAGKSSTESSVKQHAYHDLLSCFPESLRTKIARHFPEFTQLQQFHRHLVDNDLPLDREKPLAVMLHYMAAPVPGEAERNYFVRYAGRENNYSYNGGTALHMAILCWDFKLVRQLLQHSADPGKVVSPKQRALEGRAMFVAAKKLSLTKEANAPLLSEDGRLERIRIVVDAALAGNDEASTVFRAHAGENALTFAISYDVPLPIIMALVEYCAANCPALLKQYDENGNPPLVLAAATGRLDLIKFLLQPEWGLDINQVCRLQRSALMAAARQGHSDMVEFLLSRSANPALTDNQGQTAMGLAALRGFIQAHALLANHQARMTGSAVVAGVEADFHAAALRRDHRMVAALLQSQSWRISDAEVVRALRAAVTIKSNGAVIAILIRACEVNGKDKDQIQFLSKVADAEALDMVLSVLCPEAASECDRMLATAALISAAKVDCTKWLEYALDAGENVNSWYSKVSGGSRSILQIALIWRSKQAVLALVRRGAEIFNEQGGLKFSALNVACGINPIEDAREMVSIMIDNHKNPFQHKNAAVYFCMVAERLDFPGLAKRLVRENRFDEREYGELKESALMGCIRFNAPDVLEVWLSAGEEAGKRLFRSEFAKPFLVLKEIVKKKSYRLFELYLSIFLAHADNRTEKTVDDLVFHLLKGGIVKKEFVLTDFLLEHPERRQQCLFPALEFLLDRRYQTNDYAPTFEKLITATLQYGIPKEQELRCLHVAVKMGSVHAVQSLLRHGIRPHYHVQSEGSALSVALRLNHPELIELLARHGVSFILPGDPKKSLVSEIAIGKTPCSIENAAIILRHEGKNGLSTEWLKNLLLQMVALLETDNIQQADVQSCTNLLTAIHQIPHENINMVFNLVYTALSRFGKKSALPVFYGPNLNDTDYHPARFLFLRDALLKAHLLTEQDAIEHTLNLAESDGEYANGFNHLDRFGYSFDNLIGAIRSNKPFALSYILKVFTVTDLDQRRSLLGSTFFHLNIVAFLILAKQPGWFGPGALAIYLGNVDDRGLQEDMPKYMLQRLKSWAIHGRPLDLNARENSALFRLRLDVSVPH